MTKEWKAGDRAMVEIGRIGSVDKNRPIRIDGKNGEYSWVIPHVLRPLPPAMTDAEKALIEACIAEMPEWSTGFGGTVSRIHSIYDLTQAVLAERAPDPVVMFQQAYADYPEPCPTGCSKGVYKAGICGCALRAALKAYDEAKGMKS